jgi:butyryl-CoA dehydrogenase
MNKPNYAERRLRVRATLDFLLNDWLKVGELCARPRFADHSTGTFGAVLDTAEKIAKDKYAPFNRLVDLQEPHFDGEKVILPQATHDAWAAYAGSGMLAAAQDYEWGGMQLPYTVEASANAIFSMASVSISWAMLTVGNANLIMVHGTEMQKQVFAKNEFAGRWMGTMCLSEPQAGSSLSDVATRAEPDDEIDPLGPRYRLTGNKMWISGGEHEITENIVHLVLAKIPDADGKLVPGTRGISLFIVPKKLVTVREDASTSSGRTVELGERNDVALAGLNHKCGWRGTTNTLLNFGEGKFKPGGKSGAVGYLVGKPGDGLRCMFHMMNEARIGVGLAATMLGMAGYEASLDYAKQRTQGRPTQSPVRPERSEGSDRTSNNQTLRAAQGERVSAVVKNVQQKPIPIIEHADIKRMLLAQKAYCEGALALELYCARLVDETHTGEGEALADAKLLLEVLTPIAKSWPSEWCLEANSLAIQIHGGYGYTRDFPVEQYWRDNRLNMIHEGTHGIQALDLLGRKVVMDGGKGLTLLARRINDTIMRAHHAPRGPHAPELADHAQALARALQRVGAATKAAWSTGNPTEALANATPYLQAFGHTILAWIWLDVVLSCGANNEPAAAGVPLDVNGVSRSDDVIAARAAPTTRHDAFVDGKRAAMKYFFHYELPKIDAWLAVVSARDMTCANVPVEAF